MKNVLLGIGGKASRVRWALIVLVVSIRGPRKQCVAAGPGGEEEQSMIWRHWGRISVYCNRPQLACAPKGHDLIARGNAPGNIVG